MDKKRVYTFGNGQAEGKADMKNLLGGKGANLAEMNLIGIPVPPGFTITTEVCTEYNTLGRDKVVELLKDEVVKAIARVEELMNSSRINELLHKREEDEKKKNCILWVLAIIGAVAAVAGIAYAVYRFFTPDYLEDFEDDFDDDFDDDFFEDEEPEEKKAEKAE